MKGNFKEGQRKKEFSFMQITINMKVNGRVVIPMVNANTCFTMAVNMKDQWYMVIYQVMEFLFLRNKVLTKFMKVNYVQVIFQEMENYNGKMENYFKDNSNTMLLLKK